MKKCSNETITQAVKEQLEKESQMPKIKDCPFCGGHASFSVRSQSPNTIMYAKCECDDCHAVIGVSQTEIVDFIKELCIAKWNRRVADDTTGDCETERG